MRKKIICAACLGLVSWQVLAYPYQSLVNSMVANELCANYYGMEKKTTQHKTIREEIDKVTQMMEKRLSKADFDEVIERVQSRLMEKSADINRGKLTFKQVGRACDNVYQGYLRSLAASQ